MNNKKCAIIGGITGGIGSAIASQLANEDWKIIGFSKTQAKLDEFKSKHPDYELFQVDAIDSQQVNDFFKKAYTDHGKLDGYVHAIGSFLIKSMHLVTDKEWQEIIANNLSSAFYALRASSKYMQKEHSGSIVLFSSVASVCGLKNHEAIAAAKGGIHGLLLSSAASLASKQVRVNVIAPGLVETSGTAFIHKNEALRKASEQMHPLGRLGTPDEIATAATWLLSENASWVTGQVLSIDGGMGNLKTSR